MGCGCGGQLLLSIFSPMLDRCGFFVFLLSILSAILSTSIFSSTTVIAIVKTMEISVNTTWLIVPSKMSWANLPMWAPMMVMRSLPEKKAMKSFAGLYLMRPSGTITGSSGIGVAAATNIATSAHFLSFCPAASRPFRRFSFTNLPK